MLLERNVACSILIVIGRAHRAAVPVVPQSLLCAPVTADPGSGMFFIDMNAAFMSFQQHGSGIHAVWPRGWRGRGDGSSFSGARCGRWRGASGP
jgi:hypothetical protein